MTPDNLTVLTWLVVKILVLLGLGIYTVFAGVIVRQEQLMAHVLEASSETLLRTLAFVHFVASIVVIALAVILL
jgi:hypothetical protein